MMGRVEHLRPSAERETGGVAERNFDKHVAALPQTLVEQAVAKSRRVDKHLRGSESRL